MKKSMRAFAAAVCLCPGSAGTAETVRTDARPPAWHVFFGTEAASRSMFGHGGMVWAPAAHLHEPGWRVRAAADGGEFRYDAGVQAITGTTISGELLGGFEWMGADRGASLLAGVRIANTATRPRDPGGPAQGTHTGAAVRFEGWARLDEGPIASITASYADVNRAYLLRGAVRMRVGGRLAFEPEAVAFGERGYDQQRLGVFAVLTNSDGVELRIGGGWSWDPDRNAPYAGVQLKTWR